MCLSKPSGVAGLCGAENRLVRKGDVEYTNDKDGNVLSEKGLRYEATYRYNGQNRMVYSRVLDFND